METIEMGNTARVNRLQIVRTWLHQQLSQMVQGEPEVVLQKAPTMKEQIEQAKRELRQAYQAFDEAESSYIEAATYRVKAAEATYSALLNEFKQKEEALRELFIQSDNIIDFMVRAQKQKFSHQETIDFIQGRRCSNE